jgi:septal ring factor EnvC (AmiA/AmiB activator)
MKPRWALLLAPLAVLALVGPGAAQQSGAPIESAEDARVALSRAQQQGAEARSRAERLEQDAARATAEADRTARQAAALAARVQEAEAQIAANEAQIRLIGREQAVLNAELAEKQRPLIELTAALQRLSRRPPLLSLLRPGSLDETVYLRAVLDSILPEVARRTAGLRRAIERGKALQDKARQANAALRTGQAELTRRRGELAALEARQRLASRAASASADRESERALALAEETRDLSGLVVDLAKAGVLREQLAALPGPVLRPAEPFNAQAPAPDGAMAAPSGAPTRYLLPAAGRLVAGFGEARPGQPQSRGLSILLGGGAQVVAPAAGRVAFAGPYKGYGLIAIIEHGGGWTSLVTGLAELDCRVGDTLVAGASLGRMGPGRPVLGFELRRAGQPVNPLDFVR